jgi:hypothetical protein
MGEKNGEADALGGAASASGSSSEQQNSRRDSGNTRERQGPSPRSLGAATASIEELLTASGIVLEDTAVGPGRYYATCPECSRHRKPAHQKAKCLGVTVDGGGVRWGCNHCGWTGPEKGARNGRGGASLVSYEYQDGDGAVVYRKVRNAPGRTPRFYFQRPDSDGKWTKGRGDVSTVIYRLPQTRKAMAAGQRIVTAEGEKDVESLWGVGVPATCNPDGASEPGKKTKWHRKFSEMLRGADLVVTGDDDEAGRAHVQATASASVGLARSVRVLDPACWRPGKDVSDWLANGGTAEALCALLDGAPEWKPSAVSADEGAADRVSLRAPSARDEFLPVMRRLNEVLRAVRSPLPPMRNIEGELVWVRQQPAIRTHAFLSANEDADTTQPPPPQHVIRALTSGEVAEEIENYAHFYDEDEDGDRRTVRLNSAFVRNYRQRYDDALPVVSAVSVLPLVTAVGHALRDDGLNRRTGIVFFVEPELAAIMPSREQCDEAAVAEALKFLIEEWLCDVLTDFTGKCTAITAALTLIERSLLDERPTFFVTAGIRGCGKTTLIRKLIEAVLGVQAAASAWSSREEERRKALMAYLMSGVAYVLWDNIPRGEAISCPHIEKACTATVFSDRILGESQTVAASAAAVQLFTGNNVWPAGDLASRSLVIRLGADRTDPENREFKHPDVVTWTRTNRRRILRALYTVLLGNPTLDEPRDAEMKTRFKIWYRLIGSAVEHAAECYESDTKVDFCQLFLNTEDDEMTDALSGLQALGQLTSWKPFRAKFISDRITTTANDELTETVRGWLFPQEYADVTSQSVGYALKARVDMPTRGDKGVLVLKTDGGNRKTLYVVRSL